MGTLLFGSIFDDPGIVEFPLLPQNDQVWLVRDAHKFVEPPDFREILRTVAVKLVFLVPLPVGNLTPLLNLLRFNDGLPPMPTEERAFVCAARKYARFAPTHHVFEHRPVRCSPHQIQAYRRTNDVRSLTMSYPKHQTFPQCLTYTRNSFAYTGEKCFANLAKYSRKLEHLVRCATTQEPLLVYSRFLNGGAIPVALALEEAGFRRHNRPSLLHSDPGNGLKYAFVSKDANLSNNAEEAAAYLEGRVHVVVVAALLDVPFPNLRRVHFLDSPPMADIQALLAQCAGAPNLHVVLHTSLIDLDEEAVDLTLYNAAFQPQRLFLPPTIPLTLWDGRRVDHCPGAAAPTPQEILGELFQRKLWHSRADLLQHVSDLTFPDYLVNRYGHYGTVARVDDYYFFRPTDPHETLFVETRRGLNAWGAAAAPFLRAASEAEKDRVVAAHVAETCGITTLPPSRFQSLVAAHFEALTEVADVEAFVGPHGLSLWRKRGKWVPERVLPYLRTLNPDASQHTAPVELEIRLRLEGRHFLRESDF